MQNLQKRDQELTPEEIKKLERKKELMREKFKELENMQKAKQHESKYLKSHNVTEDQLIPFIEEEIKREMEKRNKPLTAIHKKMKNNTNYSKKIVDRAIKAFNKWKAE